MTHLELMIQEMADAMVTTRNPKRQHIVEALRSIAKLAVAESRAADDFQAAADKDRITRIVGAIRPIH